MINANLRRFYAPTEQFDGQDIFLDADETRHLRDVLRLSVGGRVRVFDGRGQEFLCQIEKIEKKKTALKIIEMIEPLAPESDLDLTLAVAILKGDKFDLVIQKAVELGVKRFCPINTRRGDVRLKDSVKKPARWQKIIIESSKQTGRAALMQLAEPSEFERFIKNSVRSGGEKILFAERGGRSFSKIKPGKKITALIGPEGGWEDSEIEFATENDFQIITLTGRILRAETAAIAITSLLQHDFGDLI